MIRDTGEGFELGVRGYRSCIMRYAAHDQGCEPGLGIETVHSTRILGDIMRSRSLQKQQKHDYEVPIREYRARVAMQETEARKLNHIRGGGGESLQ